MRAGEKVCIHAITPTQRSELLAARIWRRIPSGSVTTGCWTTRTGIELDRSSAVTSCEEFSATCRRIVSP